MSTTCVTRYIGNKISVYRERPDSVYQERIIGTSGTQNTLKLKQYKQNPDA